MRQSRSQPRPKRRERRPSHDSTICNIACVYPISHNQGAQSRAVCGLGLLRLPCCWLSWPARWAMFRRRKYYWHTPRLTYCAGATCRTPTPLSIPDYIAQLLAQIGLPCRPAGHTSGAQITTYHYNLIALKTMQGRQSRFKGRCQPALCTPCTLTTSDRAHIAIQVGNGQRGTLYPSSRPCST